MVWMEGTFNAHLVSYTPVMSRIPFPRPGCSNPHPTWLNSSNKWGRYSFSGQLLIVTYHSHHMKNSFLYPIYLVSAFGGRY